MIFLMHQTWLHIIHSTIAVLSFKIVLASRSQDRSFLNVSIKLTV